MDRDCANCDYSGNSFACCEDEVSVKPAFKTAPIRPVLTYEEWQKQQSSNYAQRVAKEE